MTVDRDAFIAAMRQVATTVTVVTTDGVAGCAGATVSAFSSLSADPPSVLVCLRTGSRIETAVLENAVFCVNVLPEDAGEMAMRFAGLDTSDTPSGPVLDQSLGFICTLEHSIVHGSHTICIGQVHDIHGSKEKPLTYMQGDFHVVRPKT